MGGAEGVIVNQGGFSAGRVVYLKYGYNLASLKHTFVETAKAVPAARIVATSLRPNTNWRSTSLNTEADRLLKSPEA